MANQVYNLEARFKASWQSISDALKGIATDFEKLPPTAEKAIDSINARFQLMIKEVMRVDKAMEGMENGFDSKQIIEELDKAEKEFNEMGKVSDKTMKELEESIKDVNFDKMSEEGKKAFETLGRDTDKLQKQLKHLDDVKYLESLPKDAQEAGKEFLKLKDNVDKLNKDMKGFDDGFNTDHITKELKQAETELKDMGTISKDTMDKLNKEIKHVDFDKLSAEAKQSMTGIKSSVNGLETELKELGKSSETATKKLSGDFDKAKKETGLLKTSLKGLAGGLTAAFATIGIGAFAKKLVETTAQIDAMQSQYEQVMAGMKATTDKYLDAMSQKYNVHPNELKKAILQYQAILKSKGMSEKEAYETAKMWLERTVDGSAFANESMEQSTERAMAVIKGEYDSADTIMINLSQTMLNDKAVEKYGKKWDQLTVAQQENLKVQEAIRQHTKAGVLGQGVKEANSYEKNLAQLRETWNQFLHDYGGPALQVANVGLKGAIKIIQGLEGAFKSLGKFIKSFGGKDMEIANKLGFTDAASKQVNKFFRFLQGAMKLFSGNWSTRGDGYSILTKLGVDTKTITKISSFAKTVRENFGALVDWIKKLFKDLKVGEAISDLIGGIGDFFKKEGPSILEALTNIGKAIGLVFKILAPVIKFIIKDLFETIKGFVSGILKVAKGIIQVLTGIFTGDFRKIGEGLKNIFLGAIQAIWNGFQLVFYGKLLKGALAIGKLLLAPFKSMWSALIGLFKSNGANLAKWASSLWNGMVNTVKFIFGGWKTFFKNLWSNVKNLFSNGTKNATKTAVDIFNKAIQGIKSVFNALKSFFSGFWNGLKWLFSNGAKLLWNSVTFIFKNYIDGLKVIFNNLKLFFSLIWKEIKFIFTSVVQGIVKSIVWIFKNFVEGCKAIFNALKLFFTTIWNFIKKFFTETTTNLVKDLRDSFKWLKDRTVEIFSNIRDFFVKIWNWIKEKIISIITDWFKWIRDKFNSFYHFCKEIFGRLRDTLYNIWQWIKSHTIDLVVGMYNKVKSTFQSMVDSIKRLVGNIKDTISGMISAVKGGLNKLIDGVNWVAEKLGMEKFPHLSVGTSVNRHVRTTYDGALTDDTLAVVGDKGPGNGPGGYSHEIVELPNGRSFITPDTDTLMMLPAGSKVHNGETTYNATGGARFSNGTGAKPTKQGSGGIGGIFDRTAKALGHVVGSITSKVGNVATTIKTNVEEFIGDVFDYIENPGNLVTKILDYFGVNFNFLPQLPKRLMDGMYKKMKGGLKDLFQQWLEDAGGDGESGYLKYWTNPNNIITPYSPGGPPPGYPFPWAHPGIDLPYINEPVKSTISGRAYTQEMPGGFGHYIRVVGGALEVIYGHLSKWLVKNGQHVNPGDVLGITGSTGASTGPHLHYEMHQNGHPIDPLKWLREHANTGGGRKGSVNKPAMSWTPDIVRAAKRMNVSITPNDINNIVSLIQHESNGQAGVIQNSAVYDINMAQGNPAKGLLQFIPGTFANYAVRGHNNIFSGYDQLLAFFNNQYWRSQFSPYGGWSPSGPRRYAKGGIVASPELAWIAEGGFPESIISHDPSNRVRSEFLWNQTGEMLGFSSDASNIKRLIELQKINNDYIKNIEEHTRITSEKDTAINLDGRNVSKGIAPYMRNDLKEIEQRYDRFR